MFWGTGHLATDWVLQCLTRGQWSPCRSFVLASNAQAHGRDLSLRAASLWTRREVAKDHEHPAGERAVFKANYFRTVSA